MIQPNKYILNKKVKIIDLLSNGFEKRQGTYHFKRMICKWFYVEIEIDVNDKWMTYFVKTKDLNDYYLPFYLEECRINNIVYEKVVAEFNKFMDSLCHKKILWKKKIEPKTIKRYRRILSRSPAKIGRKPYAI